MAKKQRDDSAYNAHDHIGQVPDYQEQRRRARIGPPPDDFFRDSVTPELEDEWLSEGGFDRDEAGDAYFGSSPTNLERRAKKKVASLHA